MSDCGFISFFFLLRQYFLSFLLTKVILMQGGRQCDIDKKHMPQEAEGWLYSVIVMLLFYCYCRHIYLQSTYLLTYIHGIHM